MSEDTIGLGQREVGIGDALTQEELSLVEKAGLTLTVIHAVQGIANARMTVNTLIGGALNLKKAFEEGKTPADPRGLGVEKEGIEE